MNKPHLFICLFFALIFSISYCSDAKAQVTIGSNEPPSKGAMLDLKEQTPSNPLADNSTAGKGVLYPRVKLVDKDNLFPMFQSNGTNGYKVDAQTYVKEDEDRNHIGLIVYNTTSTGDFLPGLHMWDGKVWKRIDDTPAIQPKISQVVCNSISIIPDQYTKDVPYEGILKIPYTGGNGGIYTGTEAVSIGNGLSLELLDGKLSIGGGEAIYRISGTPSVSTPTLTNFTASFLGESCNISMGSGDVKSIYVKNLSQDITISAQYANNSPGTANTLPFEGGNVEIIETGTYVFSLRLYGTVTKGGTEAIYDREPYYIYLSRNDQTTVLDAAEIDLVAPNNNTEYSYTITLGGAFVAGDKVIVSMHRPTGGATARKWILRQKSCTGGTISACPVRTSMVYWKL